jgi:hypothetical protein
METDRELHAGGRLCTLGNAVVLRELQFRMVIVLVSSFVREAVITYARRLRECMSLWYYLRQRES